MSGKQQMHELETTDERDVLRDSERRSYGH